MPYIICQYKSSSRRREMQEERLTLTVEECARVLGIGRQLAYEKVKTGEIPVLKIGRRLLVPRAALKKLLDEPNSINVQKSKE
jgi:excisionase family DNA binding protein